MLNYYMPTEIVFGKRVIKSNFESYKQFIKKPFIVTGKKSAKVSGALKDVTEVLNNLSIKYTIFDEIEENPKVCVIQRAVNLLLENKCESIICIGGGSPIDAAKAISVLSQNNVDGYNLHSKNVVFQKSLPLIAVPTTSGTGSEVTPYSVITNEKTNRKAGFGSRLMFPKISFLDPTYTLTLPSKTTTETAIDALSHLFEGIYSNRRNKINYPIIKDGANMIYENLNKCLDNPQEYFYRDKLMLASLYGGIVIAQSSTTLQHSIGYPLTSEFGISHGFANGLVMRNIMELYYDFIPNEIEELLSALKTTKTKFYDWLESFDFRLEKKIDLSFIEEKTEEIYQSRNMLLNPGKITKEQIYSLLSSLSHKKSV